ncbi:MAG: putative ABC transporter permease [Epulopiscium sp.]|nr:putative ABC transporter permease [Candidatus Epulonipiscium sp.]
MNPHFDIHILFFFFIAYSFLGWCLEVLFHIYTQKKFINRGFLHGPVCPIYGSGAVLMILFLTPLQGNLLYLFVGGVVVATLLEYVTGYVLELAFDTKWWDYSKEPLNIKGYICLRFSLAWGIAGVFLMKILHPTIEKIILAIPEVVEGHLYTLLLIVFVVDVTLTINSLIEFRKILKELVAIKAELNKKIKDKDLLLARRKERAYLRLRKRHIRFLRIYPSLTKGKFSDLIHDMKNRMEKEIKKVSK